MSLTLSISRFAFGLQYAIVSFYSLQRHRRRGLIPLAIHSFSMFAAAGGYLGV